MTSETQGANTAAPTYTYIIAGDSTGSGLWDKLITTAITSAPGVIVALIAVWFTDRLTRRRESTTAQRNFDLAQRRNEFEKSEAIRKEATQRKLDALERAATSIFAARAQIQELANEAEQAKFPEHDFGPLAEGCAFLYLHFGGTFSIQVKMLEKQYGECIKCVSAIALAAFWLSRRREEGNVDMVSTQHERQNYDGAKRQYREQVSILDASLERLLDAVRNETQVVAKAGGS